MANMEKEVVRLMAQEIISAIKKVNENNNKNYVDAQLKNVRVTGAIGGSSSSGGGAIIGDTINASQVIDLYSTVAGFISRAPANSELGDVDAGKIVTTIAGLAALEIQSATIDTAQIENLYASYGEFINLVAKNAEIENLDVEQVRADIAEMGLANIGSADIGWAQIKDLVTNTAIIREGVGGKLYIDRLAVTDAQILSLTTGELIIQGSDGKLYTVFVDENGNVQTELRVVTGTDIGGGTIQGENIAENTITGALITEHGITARELNVSQIFANEALIRAIKAANLDVDDLFANEAFINVLTTSIIKSPTIGKDIDISNNSSIVLTDKKIGLVVSSESTETELVLTDQMMEVIADQVQVSADTIDFSANESITAVVQREVAGVADTIIVGEEPQQPVVDTVWLDTSVEPNAFKRWNGTEWELIGDVADLASRMESAELAIDANTASIKSSAESIDNLNTRVQSAEEKITPEAITQTVRDSQGYKDDIASATMTSEKFETFVQNSQSISDMEMTAEKFETYVENSQGIADMEMTAEKFETYVENSEGISKLEMTPEKFETFVEGSEGISNISQKTDEIDFVIESGSSSTNVRFTPVAIDAISQNINLKVNEEFNLVVGDLESSISANANGITLVAGKADNAQSTADTAKTNAANAQSTADTAKANAATAQTAANNAQSTANTANSTANSAKTAAANAQSAANTAQNAASNAQSTADTAKANAATAQSTANAAQNAANKAQASADDLSRLTDIEVIEGTFVQTTRREGEGIHIYSEFEPKQDKTFGNPYPAGCGKNLFPAPDTEASIESAGVTFTRKTDGSIVINGTPTAVAVLYLPLPYTIPAGTSVALSLNNPTTAGNGTSSNMIGIRLVDGYPYNSGMVFGTFYARAENVNAKAVGSEAFIAAGIQVRIGASTGTLTNFVIKPQIEIGSAVTSWAPYANTPPIEGWTGLNAARCGKNLFPAPDAETSIVSADITFTRKTDGSIVINGTTTGATAALYLPLPKTIPAGTTVAISLNNPETIGTGTSTNIISVRLVDKAAYSANMIFGERANAQSTAINGIGIGAEAFDANGIQVRVGGNTGAITGFTIRPQVEIGSAATDFAEYSNKNHAVSFDETVYGGRFDWATGGLANEYEHAIIDENAYLASLSVRNNTVRVAYYLSQPAVDGADTQNVMCDTIPFRLYTWTDANDYIGTYVLTGYPTTLVLSLPRSIYGDTLESIKAKLAEKPIQVACKIAEPIETQLAPALIESLNGVNTVWTDADGGRVEFGHALVDVCDSTMPPDNPTIGRLWLDRSVTPCVLRRWSGNEWETVNDVTLIETVQDAILSKQEELAAEQAKTALYLKLDANMKAVRIGQTGLTSEARVDAFGFGVVVANEVFSRFEANRVLFGNMECRKPSAGGLALDALSI